MRVLFHCSGIPSVAIAMNMIESALSFLLCRFLTSYDGTELGPDALFPLYAWSRVKRIEEASKGRWVGSG